MSEVSETQSCQYSESQLLRLSYFAKTCGFAANKKITELNVKFAIKANPQESKRQEKKANEQKRTTTYCIIFTVAISKQSSKRNCFRPKKKNVV